MIAALALLATAASANADAEAVALPPRTVLILVAPWCAPCHGELARIDALARAAEPYAVRAMIAEDTAAARAMLESVAPAHRWVPDASTLRRARRRLLARTPGLPYSAAIDAAGDICAERGGGLDADGLHAMLGRCGAAPRGAP